MSTITLSTLSDPTATTAERVAQLRELAAADPAAAQADAWAWFTALGAATATEREHAAAELADLFGCGSPSRGLDGPTDGILVAPLIHPRVDGLLRTLTRHWMPWMGKSFDGGAQLGFNRLVGSARFLGYALFPLYRGRDVAEGLEGFDFVTRIEPGAAEPAVDVLVIDYEPVEKNPNLIIRQIRDELVEIVPGTHLGRILYRTKSGYANIGYFALRTEV
jgi:hypothetical protein